MIENLKTEDIIKARFVLRKEPVIKPFDSFVVADPTLLTPDETPDKLWHIFFHTNLAVYHFKSEDGIKFTKVQKLVKAAMRPNINVIGGEYVLFYEKTRPVFINLLNFIHLAKWKSHIEMIKSRDLINWTKPVGVVSHTKGYEKTAEGGHSISNPYMLKTDEGMFRIYYSCGLTFIKDCGFCEPTYISFAESEKYDTCYISSEMPIISPDVHDKYFNLCSGCIKVFRLSDGYIGLQNGIFERDGKSHSAIMLLKSHDGIKFETVGPLIEPSGTDEIKWMKQFVYACDMVMVGNAIRIYFNARDDSNPLLGRECIGFAEAIL